MKLRIVVSLIFLILFANCGAKKKVVQKKKNSGVILVEPIPKKLPSVKENTHVKNLENSKHKLNSHTLNYIKEYAPIAVNEMHVHKIPASITLAQGILESGNGKSLLASKSKTSIE